ncbi:DNA polymerase-like [Primulina huaijiensis]|uniref:DNA polymerase-like n=1 Tax=Primulina huaijiensis TaxID=1492673 RepID=UPI003CC77251
MVLNGICLRSSNATDKERRVLYYSQQRCSTSSAETYNGSWYSLQSNISSVGSKTVYPGSIYASTSFKEPHYRAIDFEVLTLAFIQLIEMYAYYLECDYLKITIGYTMILPSSSDLSFTLGKAIPLCDPLELPNINIEDNVIDSEIDSGKLPDVKSLISVKSRTPIKVTTIKGYLVVKSGDDLTSKPSIHTFFSEDHIPFYHTFEERSERILHDFFYNLEVSVLNIYSTRLRTIYFHNFSRFDGIIILRYFADRHKYKIRTLFRNHKLYELKIYLGDKLLFRFRDSCTLLPSSLATLGKTLCPELGSKGSIPHEDLKVSNLQVSREELINYLRQDILLLGGVMLKAQEVNWSKYHIDIEEVMTLSSLSLKIFRMHYLDDKTFPIHIPTQNQDTFIRRAFYGGHVDVYKPYGENLYYYDVNSLYPYIMKSYPMPCGVPVWRNNLESVELDSLFGFIEAYVVCPTNISRPFLPYKDQYGTLIFPTGKFIGVFYSEELKFARDLGYEIIPLRGYLFEKKSSPFESFISHLYESRLDAKKRGDEAMTFIYKILMNSLYGRFGMNPESTVTEICDQKRYEELMKKDTFQSAEKLTDH